MKVILLDDEQLALDYLEFQLKRLADVEIVGKFTDPAVAKEHIISRDIDLLFLDISLPEISGVELAEQLLAIKPQLNIVFATASDEYAVKAFALNALDYVVKPIGADRLARTLQRIQRRTSEVAAHAAQQVSAPPNSLYIGVFQKVYFELPGQRHQHQPAIHWRTARSRELFLYLLQHRRQLVRKSVLIDLLWPENESDKLYSQLYTAVYHIRKTLEPFGDHFQISSTMEGYILNLSDATLDVEEWELVIRADKEVNAEMIDEYEEMMKLYTGDYLQEYDYWWAESERQRLKLQWLKYAFLMAEWYMSNHCMDKAAALYLNICGRYPQAEEAHFALMKIYAAQGNHLAVNRQYRLLINMLQEELNEQPSPYIQEWHDNWKRSEMDGQRNPGELRIR